jgi:hypothetical protein
MRLVRSKFVAWLKARPPTEIVGGNRDCHSCPIARFYYEASGGCEVVISDTGDGYIIDRGYYQRRLPGWAESFVWTIDGDCDGKITAARALEAMSPQPISL